MRRQIVPILIVVALVVGPGIGYFGHITATNTTTETIMMTESKTTTETAISTYTITTTLPQGYNTIALSQWSSVMRCILTEYEVWQLRYLQTVPRFKGSQHRASTSRHIRLQLRLIRR